MSRSTASPRLVRQFLDLYIKHGEGWRADHFEAMACRELEELLSIGLGLFETIESSARRMQDEIARRHREYDEAEAQKVADEWAMWLEPCDAVEAAMRFYSSRGYTVEGADRFRACVDRVRRQGLNVRLIDERMDMLAAGGGISLEAAFDALQRGHSP